MCYILQNGYDFLKKKRKNNHENSASVNNIIQQVVIDMYYMPCKILDSRCYTRDVSILISRYISVV